MVSASKLLTNTYTCVPMWRDVGTQHEHLGRAMLDGMTELCLNITTLVDELEMYNPKLEPKLYPIVEALRTRIVRQVKLYIKYAEKRKPAGIHFENATQWMYVLLDLETPEADVASVVKCMKELDEASYDKYTQDREDYMKELDEASYDKYTQDREDYIVEDWLDQDSDLVAMADLTFGTSTRKQSSIFGLPKYREGKARLPHCVSKEPVRSHRRSKRICRKGLFPKLRAVLPPVPPPQSFRRALPLSFIDE